MFTAKPQPFVEGLKQVLESIQTEFDSESREKNDPVGWVKGFYEPKDQEVAGFLAALFSYGNVPQIYRTLDKLYEILGAHPHWFLIHTNAENILKHVPKTFKHRFNDHKDLSLVLLKLQVILRNHGSLESFFRDGVTWTSSHDMLKNFYNRFWALEIPLLTNSLTPGLKFLIPNANLNGACKRLFLFLRWMIGTGSMDLGIWKSISKSILLIPLDTHVLRISRHLGLTTRKTGDWKTALEITNALKLLDPQDPTRFDFALCHMGISKRCPNKRSSKICPSCLMNAYCVTFRGER